MGINERLFAWHQLKTIPDISPGSGIDRGAIGTRKKGANERRAALRPARVQSTQIT
jgi:hypothetical protein